MGEYPRPNRVLGGRIEAPRIVIVGTCASGKSTLVDLLRKKGVDAYACAQEHSAVPNLWAHQNPDLVVFLETSLSSIRIRRSANWPESIYEAQRHRLLNARGAADLVIDTDRVGVESSIELIQELIRGKGA